MPASGASSYIDSRVSCQCKSSKPLALLSYSVVYSSFILSCTLMYSLCIIHILSFLLRSSARGSLCSRQLDSVDIKVSPLCGGPLGDASSAYILSTQTLKHEIWRINMFVCVYVCMDIMVYVWICVCLCVCKCLHFCVLCAYMCTTRLLVCICMCVYMSFRTQVH
jgi:hypothetical protein